jgi:hypothetical protein
MNRPSTRVVECVSWLVMGQALSAKPAGGIPHLGNRQIDEGGNHARWAGPQGERSVVPRHREIDYRLARKICRQLQVPPPTGAR